MKNNNQFKIGDEVRLKIPIFNISSHLYVCDYFNNEYVICEYFKGANQQNTKSAFLITNLEKIIYGNVQL